MNITPEQFEELKNNGRLVLTLIGMSNIGKTYWSKKLSENGFKRLGCDDIIESKLKPKLHAWGQNGIKAISQWMGQPYEKKFKTNQKKYLRAEIESLEEILNQLLLDKKDGNIVIDLTGSIVHTSNDICLALKKHSLMIYLKADSNTKQQMLARYLNNPKPVVWDNIFQPNEGETNEEALKRCYPNLLAYRGSLYERYADVTIPRRQIEYNISAEQFLKIIGQAL